MTVKELLEELKKYPPDKIVEIGDISNSYGEAVRIIEYEDSIEIESNTDWS